MTIVFSSGALAQKDDWDRQDVAQVSWDGVAAPVGRLLLIRQEGRDVCAIRFLRVQRGDDKEPQTFFLQVMKTFQQSTSGGFFAQARPMAMSVVLKMARESSRRAL